MAELGFRPLGYPSGGILDQSDLGAVSTGDLGAISTAPVSQNAPDTLEYQFLRAVEEGPDIAVIFARTYKDELLSMVQNNAFDRAASAQIFMQMLGSGALEGGPTPSGFEEAPMAPMEGLGVYGTEAPTLPRATDMETIRGFPLPIPQPENPIDIGGAVLQKFGKGRGMGFERFPQESFGGEVYRSPNLPPPTRYVPTPQEGAGGMTSFRPEGSTLEEMGEMFDFYRDGGHVQQKYAYGGQVPRGTVAGELGRREEREPGRRGDMSAREEEETRAELAKRHTERDWYARMLQSPTLGKVRIA